MVSAISARLTGTGEEHYADVNAEMRRKRVMVQCPGFVFAIVLLSRRRQLSESRSLGICRMMKPVPIAVVLAVISVSACVSTPLALGAAKVKVTRVTADVSSCKALGYLDLDAAAAGIDNAKNHAIGLG
jgi:hypothetical protein